MRSSVGRWLFFLALTGILLPGSQAFGRKFKVVMVTDVAGLGDKSFNDAAWQGLQRARRELGVEIACLQSYEQADYVANLSLAAQEAQVVVAMGFLIREALRQVAPLFPQRQFVFIDGCVAAPNVASFEYKAQEAAYLAGILALAVSRSGVLGVVEGMDIPPVKVFEAGFRAGVKTAEAAFGRKARIKVAVAGDFYDPAKGKSLTQALIGQGADVILQLAGNTGQGVFEAVREASGVWVVGSDMDQDGIVPGKVLTSVLKRTEVAVYLAVAAAKEGRFGSGCHKLGLADGAVGLTELRYSRGKIPKAGLELMEKARRLIAEGSLQVPDDVAAAEVFSPPAALVGF